MLGDPRRRLVLCGVLVLVLTAASCGEYPGIARGGASAPGVTLPPASGGDGDTPNPGEDGAAVTAGHTPEVTLKDFELVPAELTVSAGDVTFTLVNGGRFTHDFRVEGEGIDEKAPRVSAGRTDEWGLTLTPGTYRISCPISNHADRGMVGTLTVVAG